LITNKWKVLKVFLNYQKTRNVERGKKLLGNFQGTLQSDGLNLYPIICKDLKLTPTGCMDHCRRGFDKALINDKMRATQALDLIRPLYAVEEAAREQSLTAAARLALRKEKSISLFQAFIAWCNVSQRRTVYCGNIFRKRYYIVTKGNPHEKKRASTTSQVFGDSTRARKG
jgi:hypothetical protein